MHRETPHVGLLIETSRSYGRELLRGVKRYISEHGPWAITMERRTLESPPPRWLHQWQGQGILTRTGSQALADAVRAAQVPVVELRAPKLLPDFPYIGVDNHALGSDIAEHFLERGYQHFGVYALDSEEYFRQRCQDFVGRLKQAGFACHEKFTVEHEEAPNGWEDQLDDLANWVKKLPKPAGLMACTDQLGFQLLEACAKAKVSVPEQAAVVGVEDDESLCAMSTPPLSSVRPNADRMGYEAAALLDRMMAGEPVPSEPLLIKPFGIVTRESSDVFVTEDQDIATAIRFIREQACNAISIKDVLEVILISRSALERRMRKVLGRSPQAEITRVRLNRVKQLLEETDLPQHTIAEQAGFTHPQYMAEVFKREIGITPGTYRQQHRR